MTSRSLRHKLGKLFMFGFHGRAGQALPTPLLRFLEEWGLTGLIVFTRNASTGPQLQDLVAQLRGAAPGEVLVAIDHEGGPVLRLSEGVSQLPSAMGLAASGDPARARQAGTIAGRELAALGVDVNLAPVLDVNSNPDNPGIGLRSFGETPARVEAFDLSYLEGLQATGISATAKHFPGKGSASLDAHFDLPFIGRSAQELAAVDFPPFVRAIRQGVHCVMGSHTGYQAFGDEVPGTLSRRVMTDLLRGEMGFEGVLLTDDMEMGAIRDHFGFERAIMSSFDAGADQLLICHDPEKQEAALRLMEQAVLSGEVAQARVDASVQRVTALLERHARRRREPVPALGDLVARHQPALRQMWRESICLVRDPRAALPLTAHGSLLALFPVLAELSPVEESSGGEPALARTLAAALPGLQSLAFTPKQPGPIEQAQSLARGADATVFFSYNAHVDPSQTALLEAVREASRRFVLVALRNPTDLRLARPQDAAMATLGFRPGVLAAAGDVLLGHGTAAGRLPVDRLEAPGR